MSSNHGATRPENCSDDERGFGRPEDIAVITDGDEAAASISITGHSRNVNCQTDNNSHPSPLPMTSSVSGASLRRSSIFQPAKILLDRTTILVGSLSFSVGWANALSFEYYRAYATMMTGNWINFGYAVGEGRGYDALFFLAVIFCFVFGHSVYRFVSSPKLFPRLHKHASSALAPTIFVLCFLQDVWIYWAPSNEVRYVVVLLSMALGMVTSAASIINGIICNMFTGHTTSVTNVLFDVILEEGPLSNEKKKSAFRSTVLIIIFLMGIIFGTVLRKWVYLRDNNDFDPVFTPLGVVFAFIMCLHDFQVNQGDVQTEKDARQQVLEESIKT